METAECPHNIAVSEQILHNCIEYAKRNDAFKCILITHRATLPLSKRRKHFLDEYMDIEETQLTLSYFCNKDFIESAPIVIDEIKLDGEVSTYLCFRDNRTSMEIYFPVVSMSTFIIVFLQKLIVHGLGSQLEQPIRQYITSRIIGKLNSVVSMEQSCTTNDTKKRVPICYYFFTIVRSCLQINPVGPCLYCGSPIYGLPGRVTAAIGDIRSDIATAVNLNLPIELFGSDTLEKHYPSLETSLPSRLYAFTEIGDSGAYTLPFYTHPTLVLCDNFVDLTNLIYIEQGDFSSVVNSRYNTFTDDEAATSFITYSLTSTEAGVFMKTGDDKYLPPRYSHSIPIFYPYHNACADTIRAVHNKIDEDTVLRESVEEVRQRVETMHNYYNGVIREVRDKLRAYIPQAHVGNK